MDQGVTRALKAFYCANVVRRQTKYIDAGRTTSKINILEAMRMLVRSWDTVSANTVKNCYREAGILEETQIASKMMKMIFSSYLKKTSMSFIHMV